MKLVVQRVSDASVEVDERIVGQIDEGLMVLVGFGENDTEREADYLSKKLVKLRIFQDENGKTNLNIDSVGGNILLISQFTLYADCRKGNRPSFTKAAPPDLACALWERAAKTIEEQIGSVSLGRFGAHMEVSLCNDGPFTVMLDSAELF